MESPRGIRRWDEMSPEEHRHHWACYQGALQEEREQGCTCDQLDVTEVQFFGEAGTLMTVTHSLDCPRYLDILFEQ
jgi:hypothetical protein